MIRPAGHCCCFIFVQCAKLSGGHCHGDPEGEKKKNRQTSEGFRADTIFSQKGERRVKNQTEERRGFGV